MMRMHTAHSSPDRPIQLAVDLLRKEFSVEAFLDSREPYRFRVPFSLVSQVLERKINEVQRALILPLDSPPEFFRKTNDIAATHDPQSQRWTDNKAWFRVTDIFEDGVAMDDDPVRLRVDNALIDIGEYIRHAVAVKSLTI